MHTVISVFDDRETAQRAVERLTEAGFARADVHLEAKDASSAYATSGTADMTGATASGARAGTTSYSSTGSHRTSEDRGVMGSIGSFFSSLFGSDKDSDVRYLGHAERYSEAVRRGGYVVVVDANSETDAERAADMMSELGAVDIDERAEQWRSAGWTGASYNDSTAPPSGQQMMVGTNTSHPNAARVMENDSVTGTGRPPLGKDPYVDNSIAGRDPTLNLRDTDEARTGGLQGERKFDVVEEELQVGKRSVDRGGVRVVQRVSDKPVSEIVRLREEHAVVERRDVDRDATSDDLKMGQDMVVEVRETVEEPVVSKRSHVVGEVVVNKEVREREETITDTVRRKDVEVERLDEHAAARDTNKELLGKGSVKDPGLAGTREPKDVSNKRKP